jgi:thiol:disulfide interchange protein DsbD
MMVMKNRICSTLLMIFLVLAVQAQLMDPVHFTSRWNMTGETAGEIVFSATIDDGWHVYSTDLGSDGPTPAAFHVVKMEGAETVGTLMPRGHVIKQYDRMFGMELRFFEKKATFVQRVRVTKPKFFIEGYLEYGACNDEMCLPPTQVEFRYQGEVTVSKTQEEARGHEGTEAREYSDGKKDVAHPSPITQHPSPNTQHPTPLPTIFLLGLLGGLLAVLMPCIWPIIPMTVSFFLKRAKDDQRKGIRDAIVYGISIVVIYLSLGLFVTALFGSDTLNALSTNAVFNVLLFVLLVVFALSFFGWFEIKLPEGWATKVDAKADELSEVRGKGNSQRHTLLCREEVRGYLSIFLMAFTLVLVSFSCTAPIVGLLLVETATTGNWLSPAVGMLGFALALALPFTLFALFPSWLKQAPKSGAWMNILKVTLGFIELAFALKFLSVADLAYGWHILDREVFLSLWIVIFTLLGAYLCGWLKFQSDEVEGSVARPMPVVCIMGGLVSLAFAVYMVPGLWGAPCKAVSAFAPPMSTQDFNLNSKTVVARFTDFDQALAAARAEGKPLFVDFTGYGCVNCRKMEAAVWTDPRVADLLTNDYVLVSLFVDDKTPLEQPIEVTDALGRHKTLRTVGARWSYLQSTRFGANAQPYYIILDTDGRQLLPSRAYDEDVSAYLDFLQRGLQAFKETKN